MAGTWSLCVRVLVVKHCRFPHQPVCRVEQSFKFAVCRLTGAFITHHLASFAFPSPFVAWKTQEAMLNSGAAGFVLSRESLRLLRLAWGEDANDSAEMDTRADAAEMDLREDEQMIESRVQSECVAKSKFEKDNPGM